MPDTHSSVDIVDGISSSMTSPTVLPPSSSSSTSSTTATASSSNKLPLSSSVGSPCHSNSPSPPSLSLTTASATHMGSASVNGGGGSSGSVGSSINATTMNGTRGSRDMIGLQATTCGTRQLSKVKRFLTTLQQFGSDISPEAGERVRGLIFNLVNGTLSIDDFHHKLQDTTNFPLRPFVIPFLKANLPLLQREIVHCARAAKQSPQQYLHHHEHLVLDPVHSPTESTSGELLFHHHPSSSTAAGTEINENGKRRLTDRHKDNGHLLMDTGSQDLGPPHKRLCHSLLSPPLAHPASSNTLGLSHRLDDLPLSSREYRDRERMSFERDYRHYGFTPRDMLMDERENDEEWKSINTMLNCILGMVEKTKRALAILQHRSQSDRQELAMWVRRHAEGAAENSLKKQAGDMMIQSMKNTEDRVSEVKRKAVLNGIVEEAVNEVKRQAVAELQKAVSAAEVKAREMVASERGKMEKLIMEARIQAAEEALAVLNQQADNNEACWNCGRKASETCSGCNNARYCGAFCQHKDWENHHLVCGQGRMNSSNVANTNTTSSSSSSCINSKSAQSSSQSAASPLSSASSSTSASRGHPSGSNTVPTSRTVSDSKLIPNDVIH